MNKYFIQHSISSIHYAAEAVAELQSLPPRDLIAFYDGVENVGVVLRHASRNGQRSGGLVIEVVNRATSAEVSFVEKDRLPPGWTPDQAERRTSRLIQRALVRRELRRRCALLHDEITVLRQADPALFETAVARVLVSRTVEDVYQFMEWEDLRFWEKFFSPTRQVVLPLDYETWLVDRYGYDHANKIAEGVTP